MKKLIVILSLIITITALNFITIDQTNYTVSTENVGEVNIGSAQVTINEEVEKVTYSNDENTLAFLAQTDFSEVTITESKNLLGQTKYHVTGLK